MEIVTTDRKSTTKNIGPNRREPMSFHPDSLKKRGRPKTYRPDGEAENYVDGKTARQKALVWRHRGDIAQDIAERIRCYNKALDLRCLKMEERREIAGKIEALGG